MVAIETPPVHVPFACALPPGFESIEPPPGLTAPAQEELAIAQDPLDVQGVPENASVGDSEEPIAQQDFKVLLRNLPDSICIEPMIWVMLEQASLDTDVLSISTR